MAFLTLFVVLLFDVPLPGNWLVAWIRIFNTVLVWRHLGGLLDT
ncbi:hypothetical protein [Dictyobacter vulcani]|nr:hypothetical protein [Dictyobacter vulcani]